MATEPPSRSKTIDNLGIDLSIRYAKDQEYLDKTFIKEVIAIPEQTRIDASLPCFSSEFESMFQTSLRNKDWASFLTPPGFKDQKRGLFSFQIVPSLGTEDTQQLHADRIRSRLNRDRENRKKKQQEEKEAFEEDIEFKEEEKESEIILRLIELISNLDRILIEIHGRKNQFQKG
jgi:hypothetical protein